MTYLFIPFSIMPVLIHKFKPTKWQLFCKTDTLTTRLVTEKIKLMLPWLRCSRCNSRIL